MKAKVIIFLFFIVVFMADAQANPLVEKADSAYVAKQYTESIQLYQTVLATEGSNAELYCNLGNAYYQTGDYGNAMLSWLRGHKLDPSLSEINSNIRYLESRVEDANKAEQKGKRLRTSPDEPSFFESVHSSIAQDTSSDTWAVLAATCFILFVAALAIYIFSRNVIARKIGFFGGLCFIAASVVFLSFAFMSARQFYAEDEGVVTAYKVTLLTEPGKNDDASKGLVLTKGTPVQILSEEVDAEGKVTWFKVRLNSDYIGWVAASDMEIVGDV